MSRDLLSRDLSRGGPSLDTETRPFTDVGAGPSPLLPALTVIAHRDPRRVGELAALTPLLSGKAVVLSRLEPGFAPRRGRSPEPLGDRRLSRKGLHLTPAPGGGVILDPGHSALDVFVEGTALTGPRTVTPEELEVGVTLLLSRSVCLLLHRLDDLSLELALEDDGMIGESRGLQAARRAVKRAAVNDDPVLIRGETGCGKEPTAASLHRQSRRGDRPLRTVSLAEIPGEMAASSLFGSVPGAYTGATRRVGHFQSARGTTLVLDEIGLAGLGVQQTLLRAIENREVLRVGATEPESVDVRLVASTDRDLEEEIRRGRFFAPLLHRLEANRIHLPPLRRRRDDIGRLFYAFVEKRLRALGRGDRFERDGGSWIPPWLVERLVRHRWPGNVRELQNLVRALVDHGLEDDRMSLPPELEERITAPPLGSPGAGSPGPGPSGPAAPPREEPTYRDADGVDDGELEQTLEAADYVIAAAARQLGVRRSALIERIARHPDLRFAKDIPADEIQGALGRFGFDPEVLASHFRVSKKALKDHVRRLGLHPDGD